MAKNILVYDISDYPEMGGGVQFENFEEETDMHKRVDELANQYKERFSVICAGWLQTEYEYKPVVQIIKYEPIRK